MKSTKKTTVIIIEIFPHIFIRLLSDQQNLSPIDEQPLPTPFTPDTNQSGTSENPRPSNIDFRFSFVENYELIEAQNQIEFLREHLNETKGRRNLSLSR